MAQVKSISDPSENRAVLIVAIIFQWLTLVLGLGAIRFLATLTFFGQQRIQLPIPEEPDQMHFWTQNYWLVALIIGLITFLVGLIPAVLSYYRRRQARQQESTQVVHLFKATLADLADHTPALILIQTYALGAFTIVPAITLWLALVNGLSNPLLLALFFASPGIVIFCGVEGIIVYEQFNQDSPRSDKIFAAVTFALRVIGALMIWVYLGLAISYENLDVVLVVGAVFSLIAIFLTMRVTLRDLKRRGSSIITANVLTRIYGINPQVQRLLWANDILTYEALALQSPDDLQQLLDNEQKPYQGDPITWPYQARLAFEDATKRLDEFEAALHEHDPIDDLTKILGIDRGVQQSLWDMSVLTYEHLLTWDAAALARRFSGASHNGEQTVTASYADTWPIQARLLLDNQLEALKALQETLTDGHSRDALGTIVNIDVTTESILNRAGIISYEQVSCATTDELVEIVRAGGLEPVKANIQTWPRQATLLAAGDEVSRAQFDALIQQLNNGTPRNLTVIHGIDREAESLLYQSGIFTLADLANSKPAALVTRLNDLQRQHNIRGSYLVADVMAWPTLARGLIEKHEQTKGSGFIDIQDTSKADLTLIDGLTLQISQVLATDLRILTFAQLGDANIDQLRRRLDEHRIPYDLNRIMTWPALAELAADGNWREFEDIQAALAEESRRLAPDRLTRIRGIDEPIESLLYHYHIRSLKQLAAAESDDLINWLGEANISYNVVNVLSWSYQASLLLDDDHDALGQLLHEIEEPQQVEQPAGPTPNKTEEKPTSDAASIAATLPPIDEAMAQQLSALIAQALQANTLQTPPQEIEKPEEQPEVTPEPEKPEPPADEFTQIEGIGPKVAALLRRHKIGSMKKLSTQTEAGLRRILKSAGEGFELLNPLIWPYQARLILEEKHEVLATLQADLKHWQTVDDLTRIEGVGPKTQEILWRNGYFSYGQLAAESPDVLQAILNAQGVPYSMASAETWPQQAQMANGARWNELDALQEILRGGRRTQ